MSETLVKKNRGRPKGSKNKCRLHKIKGCDDCRQTKKQKNKKTNKQKINIPKIKISKKELDDVLEFKELNNLDDADISDKDIFNLDTDRNSVLELDTENIADDNNNFMAQLKEKIRNLTKTSSNNELELELEEEPNSNIDFQRNRLRNMALRNPKILTDKLDCDVLKKINKMSDEEIEQRLYFAERFHSNEFDKKIGSSVINVLNLGVGKFLGCYEELKNQTDKNEELNSIVMQQLGGYLDLIPSNLKGLLVYGSSVGNAYLEKKKSIDTEDNDFTQS